MFNDGNSGFTMPVAPAYYGGHNDGLFGGDGALGGLLLGLLFGGLGGWGGFGGFGGFGGGWGGMMGFDYATMPYFYNAQTQNDVNRGFADANIASAIRDVSSAVTSGFGDVNLGIAGVNQNICNTGNNVVSAVTGAQNAISAQLYNNEIASLNRSFDAQTANSQGLNAVQSQLAQIGCDNRLATNDLKYTIATENCADRAALSDGIRDLLAATQAQTQTILTQMCNDKIEQKNDTINQLRQELIFARGQASQDVQTADIKSNNAIVANQLVSELRTCPIPAVPVFGDQRIFTCGGNNGFGCGCGN